MSEPRAKISGRSFARCSYVSQQGPGKGVQVTSRDLHPLGTVISIWRIIGVHLLYQRPTASSHCSDSSPSIESRSRTTSIPGSMTSSVAPGPSSRTRPERRSGSLFELVVTASNPRPTASSMIWRRVDSASGIAKASLARRSGYRPDSSRRIPSKLAYISWNSAITTGRDVIARTRRARSLLPAPAGPEIRRPAMARLRT